MTYSLGLQKYVQLHDNIRELARLLMALLALQLCDGASAAERQNWQLGEAKEYHYLNQSSCYQLKDVDNAAEYKVSTTYCILHCFGNFSILIVVPAACNAHAQH